MPSISFSANLSRRIDCPEQSFEAADLTSFLDQYFSRYPQVRNHILDNQGAVRKHIMIVIDGVNLEDRQSLGDTLRPTGQIHVYQALSGGMNYGG